MLRQKMWKWHRVIGYVIGLQIMLWIMGGVVMSWFDIETVRGEHNIAKQEVLSIPNPETLVPLSSIIDGDVTNITVSHLLGMPIYNLRYAGGEQKIFNAQTGEQLTPISKELALAIAKADFAGEASPEIIWMEENNTEYRGAVPVWQITMNDEENTFIYVSPTAGRVVARRNSVWRLFDFFWMLHIMDYEDRTDFNNLLLQVAAFVAFIFTITGFVLIYFRLAGKKRRKRNA